MCIRSVSSVRLRLRLPNAPPLARGIPEHQIKAALLTHVLYVLQHTVGDRPNGASSSIADIESGHLAVVADTLNILGLVRALFCLL